MNNQRATAAHDSRANTATPLDEYDGPEPGAPGTVEVYVLVAHPDDTASFVVDVYGSREEAAAEQQAIEDEHTAVSLNGFLVDPRECPVPEAVW